MEIDVNLRKPTTANGLELKTISAGSYSNNNGHSNLHSHLHNNNNSINNHQQQQQQQQQQHRSSSSNSNSNNITTSSEPLSSPPFGCCGILSRLLCSSHTRAKTGTSSGDYNTYNNCGTMSPATHANGNSGYVTAAATNAVTATPHHNSSYMNLLKKNHTHRRTPQEIYFESRGKSCKKLLKFNGNSNKNNVALYYAIVFVIIFIPCIGAFFWFNSIIARKLWKRRHIAAITKRKTLRGKTKNQTPCTNETPKTQQPKCSFLSTKNCNCKSGHTSSSTLPSSLTNTLGGKMTTTTDASATTNNTSNVNNSREARHLRMFTIILLMMAVFVFLRLPAWIFLLMRMYGSYTKPTHWILYFVFGLMNLASSVLNPLFYTFLTETIQYTLIFKAKVSSVLCCCYSQLCCCCYRVKYDGHKETTSSAVFPPNPNECHSTINMENVKEPWHAKIHCCEYLCGCSGFLRASLSCYQPHLKTEHKYKVHTHSVPYENENRSKEESEGGQATNNDKDEGVDCSDEIDDEDVRDFYEYNQKIYTIFPPSLVSSSINSQMS
ncbi:ras guanine nucleotide exchange factor B isoform X1 [Lucilia cuprina]|uniref:ras guanine nucleotide exchange factor B isoform X1 n=1 Tax=Lucilia cuprina TaxID=7375 RepID=UPI001F05B88A|nr:ras guanine nucleotide exchange factor B isoform X1 [Lucilia cuprina]XP_046811720.1 ras guanine nucleotide exchange factor B isoform X1 [Lucilia cuprina]XP_046811721.1 ras guanine nucleotide exchange factor B isoform X1 [Lucilia cuprina]XP_046811722.1 ras guanine nucleotide exchange factor B isoform X1 [Lucilia cuprina]